MPDFASLGPKYFGKGIILDSNLLLLFILGSYNRSLVGNYKRIAQFTTQDFDLLVEILSRFARIIATPMILTEVNSLANAIPERDKQRFYSVFATLVLKLTEHTKTSPEIVSTDHFKKVGFADTSIILVSQQNYLVLTDDFVLSGYLAKLSLDAINFNHLRLYQPASK